MYRALMCKQWLSNVLRMVLILETRFSNILNMSSTWWQERKPFLYQWSKHL